MMNSQGQVDSQPCFDMVKLRILKVICCDSRTTNRNVPSRLSLRVATTNFKEVVHWGVHLVVGMLSKIENGRH